MRSQEGICDRLDFIFSKTIGDSMRPIIWGGQHWVAGRQLDDEPQVGDILMFRLVRDGQEINVDHRLVKIEGDGPERVYCTRGDNCLGGERIRRKQIIGRVAEVHRVGPWRPWHAIWRRKFSVTDPDYLCYSRMWMATWPARRLWFRVLGAVFVRWRRLAALLRGRKFAGNE